MPDAQENQQAMHTAPSLKYRAQIGPLEDCPPQGILEPNGPAFRLVHAEPTAENFLPHGISKPWTLRGQVACCKGWGLSLFDSVESLMRMVEKALERYPQFMAANGNTPARIELTSEVGIVTPTDSKGHLTLYEFEGVDLLGLCTLEDPIAAD